MRSIYHISQALDPQDPHVIGKFLVSILFLLRITISHDSLASLDI